MIIIAKIFNDKVEYNLLVFDIINNNIQILF